ncbi:MAG TPA: RteC domain-containing protein [Niabella sp.]|nr:RteC domain-containing protein [Niabella sp.]
MTTGSKAALTKLIYAFHSQNVFDNGNAGIKDIAKSLI